jgi:HEAT repeat protein
VRQGAADALEKTGWKPANDRQRAYYVVALRKWDQAVGVGRPAVDPLIAVLADGLHRRHAEIALEKIGPAAVGPLAAALSGADGGQAHRAVAGVLAKLGWKPSNDRQRAEYLVALGNCDEAAWLGTAALEPLVAALKGPSVHARRAAARALGELDDRRAVEPLIAALRTYDAGVRQQAAQALGRIGPAAKSAVPALTRVLSDSRPAVRETAAEAIKKITGRKDTD